MDEPLSNLDANLRVEMRSVIKEIQNSLFSGIQAEEDIKTGILTEQLALEMLIMKLSSEKE